MKTVYTTPELTVHGSVETLTQTTSKVPTKLDATFADGTAFAQLTFSA